MPIIQILSLLNKWLIEKTAIWFLSENDYICKYKI